MPVNNQLWIPHLDDDAEGGTHIRLIPDTIQWGVRVGQHVAQSRGMVYIDPTNTPFAPNALDVYGDTALFGNLTVGGTINGSTFPVTTGVNLTLTGTLTTQSITLTDSDMKHGQRKLMLSGAHFSNRTQDYATIGNFVQLAAPEGTTGLTASSGSPSNPVWGDIPLTVGDRIIEVDAYVLGQTGAGNTMTLKVWKMDMTTGTVTQLGATVTSALSATNQTLARTGLTEVIADGFCYWLSVLPAGSADFGIVRGARIIYDRP